MQPEALRVGGLAPFSTVDFPGQLCAVVFCQGCPWKCRYCHNPHLQPFDSGVLTWLEVVHFLENRRGLLDGVVFSGGEPTAQAALGGAMRTVRGMGFKVALHTAGIYPDRFARILPLVDWVGLDIKAPFDERYDSITRSPKSHRSPRVVLDLLLASGVGHEIRTTVHPSLLGEDALASIDSELNRKGDPPTRRQKFRSEGCLDAELIG